MKKISFILIFLLTVSSCTFISKGQGQVIFHWEKQKTGIKTLKIQQILEEKYNSFK